MSISGENHIDRFYTGTSGLLLPVPNKEFYPEEFKDKSRLHYYGSLFNSIEVNSSFYKMPMASTVVKWAADVPESFRFTFKLFRDVSHAKGLSFDPALVAEYMQRIDGAGANSGALLIQFPGSITAIYIRELEHLLITAGESNEQKQWHIAVEFRHNSWYTEHTQELLQKYGAGMVVHDKLAKGGPDLDHEADFVYLRFHGPGGDYRGSYTNDFLYEYSTYITEWLQDQKTVYCYFNNTMGNAISNLNTLREAVSNNI
ncbi:hypothetical protein PBAL39_07495 [Pedobacter sp. BAL39]|uniref:DUF72 domain-containing protein n=1 Tax=Pedobacter sp. BAL39 TaxID=391596 RepID=UPI0001559D42|nr:DUF72 domain-containing protein [Pedobacter sp. BAL39]EDM35513.1 hypothetical protein PBAL39_07495 [Pedobacter sp. BAL39]